MKKHFCYLGDGYEEPKLRLYGEVSPWYNQVTTFGWITLIVTFSIFTGLCTGLYSCRKEIVEVFNHETKEKFEYPIGRTFDAEKQIEDGSPKSKKPSLVGSKPITVGVAKDGKFEK